MEGSDQPRNRKERRAAAKEASKSQKGTHLDQTSAPFKLAQPDRSGPKGKTLYDLAEERRQQLEKEGFYKEQEKREKERKARGEYTEYEVNDEPLGAGGDAILYSMSLTMVHFTLDVMVFNQYRQEIIWKEIFGRTGVVLPVLFIVTYLLHTQTAMRLRVPRQMLFLGTAIAAGCFLIKSGNKQGYYAVMKKAPPIGTIWIWSVIEMELAFAAASVVPVIAYMWYNGFTAF